MDFSKAFDRRILAETEKWVFYVWLIEFNAEDNGKKNKFNLNRISLMHPLLIPWIYYWKLKITDRQSPRAQIVINQTFMWLLSTEMTSIISHIITADTILGI